MINMVQHPNNQDLIQTHSLGLEPVASISVTLVLPFVQDPQALMPIFLSNFSELLLEVEDVDVDDPQISIFGEKT